MTDTDNDTATAADPTRGVTATPTTDEEMAAKGPTGDAVTAVDAQVPATGVAATSDATPSDATATEATTDVASAVGAGTDKASIGDASIDQASTDQASTDQDSDEDQNPLEAEAEIAADYLEELLDIADLDGDIDTFIDGDRAHVCVMSESQVLVGPDGKVLDALQELARLAVMTETGDRSRLMLDVAGYRDRRRTELVALATEAVEQVRSTNESVTLSAMNPFERKIVHDAVASAGLTSASDGVEPERRVVVRPAA